MSFSTFQIWPFQLPVRVEGHGARGDLSGGKVTHESLELSQRGVGAVADPAKQIKKTNF